MRLAFVLGIALCLPVAGQDAAAAHFAKGKELAAKGQMDDARDEYRAALRLRPEFVAAHIEMARIMVAQKQYEPALASIDNALHIAPKNVDAELLRAQALVGLGKAGVARLFLKDALAANPDNTEVMHALGRASLADSRFEEAEEAFGQLAKAEPDRARGVLGVAESYLAREQKAKAVQVMQAAAAKAPDNRDLQREYGNIAVRTGQYDVSVAAFQRALGGADAKTKGDLYLRLGEVYHLKGDVDSSLSSFRKARDAQPENPLIVGTLAVALDSAGQRGEARGVYETALKLDPRNPAMLNNLAYLLCETGGDLVRALELAQKARELLPSNEEVADTMGWIYLKSNMTEAATALFRSLVRRAPERSTFHFHLGMALAKQGDREGAMASFKEALSRGATGEEEARVKEAMQKLNAAPTSPAR